MLLKITYKGENTQELGYLLHKNPYRAQQFELSFGKAYVFYPEVSDERTTAALLLDMDPIELARGKTGSSEGGLFDYVNDRPYASSSFMSTAINRIFGTAMSGRCDKRPELAEKPLDLTARLYCLNDGGSDELAHRIFEPLGYTVETKREKLDDRFIQWGESPYITLTISAKVRLCDLLDQLYVLIPVFDRQKHYYTDEAEIEKLMKHGERWLKDHPERDKIIYRYFSVRKSYARRAIDILLDSGAEEPAEVLPPENETAGEQKEKKEPLNKLRLEAVRKEVLSSGASSVIDMGCGEGRLTALLLKEKQIKKVTACDVSVRELEKAKQRLKVDTMQPYLKDKLTLMQASLTYRDDRFSGFDCACLTEVIEHIEPMRLTSLEHIVFGIASPRTVIITTPNKEYNAKYEFLPEDALRHDDHRFEWTRLEFLSWAKHKAEIKEVGEHDDSLGSPTQMGVFTKCV